MRMFSNTKQSKKFQSIVKTIIALKTLVQIEYTEACYWIASLLNEICNDTKKYPFPVTEYNTDTIQLNEVIQTI